MSESYIELSPPFTTADTEGPVRLSFDGSCLVAEFSNYKTSTQRLVFSDVRSFAWTGWEGTPTGISPDRIYEVKDSKMLAGFAGFLVGELSFRHFKLGFNAEAKYLDVIATTMVLEN